MTKVEQDQILIEKGNNYINLPENNYQNNPQVTTFKSKFKKVNNIIIFSILTGIEFDRSKTMPNLLRKNTDASNLKKPKTSANKLDAEKQKILQEHHDRIQNLQYVNRHKEIENINAKNDIRVLRQKTQALENSRGHHPNLKQNIKPHVSSFYDQERKFLGERAELYKSQSYNPHLVKQYVESVQHDSKVSATLSNGGAFPSQKDVFIENYEHRPKLFSDKVFNDFKILSRAPLENILKNPNHSAEPVLQENGLIQQQSTYGQSYNTKKFLQENPLVGTNHSNLHYVKLDQAELDHQDITLKSRADYIALNEYRLGNSGPGDLNNANKIIEKLDTENNEKKYPRYVGTAPPYEPLYCTTQITEMSDGYSKRDYQRVYDSPYVNPPTINYEPLKSDLDAMKKYQTKVFSEMAKQVEDEKNLIEKHTSDSCVRITHIDKSQEQTSRKPLDKITEIRRDQNPVSVYQASYTPFSFDIQKPCPPNQFYKDISYSQAPNADARISNESVPTDLVNLQDTWSKSLAHKNYHLAHPGGLADLRENIHSGKKIIYEAPANAYRFA